MKLIQKKIKEDLGFAFKVISNEKKAYINYVKALLQLGNTIQGTKVVYNYNLSINKMDVAMDLVKLKALRIDDAEYRNAVKFKTSLLGRKLSLKIKEADL